MCVCVVKPARTTQHRRLFDFRFRWCAYRARIVVNSWYKLQMAARLQTRAGPPARPADFNQSCQGCRSTGGWMQTEADAFVSCSKKEREREKKQRRSHQSSHRFFLGLCILFGWIVCHVFTGSRRLVAQPPDKVTESHRMA